MADRKTPLTTEGRLRVAKKIEFMTKENKKKKKEDRRSREQIAAIAYDMERRGELG